jgi:hypothetical protein
MVLSAWTPAHDRKGVGFLGVCLVTTGLLFQHHLSLFSCTHHPLLLFIFFGWVQETVKVLEDKKIRKILNSYKLGSRQPLAGRQNSLTGKFRPA